MKYENNMQTNTQRYSVVDVLSTHGRIGRQAYFVYSIILPLAMFWILATVASLISKLGSVAGTLSYALITISLVVVMFTVVRLTIQRCHDFNASSGLAWFALIPFANIVFALIPGNNGLNSYGEAPEPPSIAIKTGATLLTVLLLALIAFVILRTFGISI